MATIVELSERLLKRFKGVPNYTLTDAEQAIDDALLTLGYASADDVPDDKLTALLLLAQSESAYTIAFSTAHYFQYSDGEESVNKSMISENYRTLASDLRKRYDNLIGNDPSVAASSFHVAARVDATYGQGAVLGRRLLR